MYSHNKAIPIAEIAVGALLVGVGVFDLVTSGIDPCEEECTCKKTKNPSIPLDGFEKK